MADLNLKAGTNITLTQDDTDLYINSTTDTSGLESTSNKVTTLSSSSTDTQYPSAKCVYDAISNIDLTDYVKNTDYGTDTTGGVIKTNWGSGTYMSNGALVSRVADYNTYQQLGTSAFISKGTLDNVLTAQIGAINDVLDAINGEVI